MERKKLDLLALASIPLVMTLGNSMLIPVLPMIESVLKISQLQSSLIITVYSIVAIILIPIAGYLSDRFGRKKVIIPSLILTAIGGGIAAFASWQIAEPYLFIILGRLLQGVGASGAFPVTIPTVGDMYQAEEDVSRDLGIIETANTFGKVLSPILGASLGLVIWYLPFIFVPIFSILSLLLVIFLLKVPQQKQTTKPKFRCWIWTANCRGNRGEYAGALYHFSNLKWSCNDCLFIFDQT
ncbi:MAG TPA: MFS transporter [Bacilli bacterium]|nr:MFS transporter [Bacilli bacterium]